jgi:Cytochrome c biogenesis factor
VIELDPRNAGALSDMGYTYLTTRRYAEAEQTLRRAQIIDPANEGTGAWLLEAIVFGRGDTAAGRELVASLGNGASAELRAYMDATLARLARHFDSSSAALNHTRMVRPADRPQRLLLQALNDMASGAPARARGRADSAAPPRHRLPRPHARGRRVGNAADCHPILGVANALRGRADEAVREGERALALNPAARDPSEGSRSVDGLIAIQLLLGHRDEAIRLITQQAHAPLSSTTTVFITQASIRLDPLFDGIRGDPRIQALLQNDAAWVVR